MSKKYDNYIKIHNNGGKVWLLPEYDLRRGLLLYQPSSIRGRVLKNCLPLGLKIPMLRRLVKKIIKTEDCVLEIESKIDEIIRIVFGKENIVYSCFLGTPSKHQKRTIQIATSNGIVGYCKVTSNSEVARLFVQEKKILDTLDECDVANVPKCLHCGELDDGTTVFVQDTKKGYNSKVVRKLTDIHFEFLRDLANKTKCQCEYGLSDYYLMLRKFERNIGVLGKMGYDERVFRKSILCVERELKDHSWFSIYHGDFTPWNTFREKGHLFAFDFEYAKETYPPYLDLFHFFTQSLVFEKGMTAEKIFNMFEAKIIKKSNSQLFSNIYCAYLQYLIHIVAFYIERDQEEMKEDDLRCVSIWYQIMVCILESGKV